MKVITVGSHLVEIDFGGARVPLGFLATFRRTSHSDCKAGNGFVVQGTTHRLCMCALNGAAARLAAVGASEFQRLAVVWLDGERLLIIADEERCRREGSEAEASAVCPYPPDSDQALAWEEGHGRRHLSPTPS